MTIELYKLLYNKLIYQPPYDPNTKIFSVCITNFDMNNINNINDKWNNIKYIMDIPFINDKRFLEKVINDMNIVNKIYFKFYKLYKIYLKKKLQYFSNEYDLLGNKFIHLPTSCKIDIIENFIIYTFKISDIINIINYSLSKHYKGNQYIMLEPTGIKNPYTNLEFSYSSLLYIYNTIKKSNYKMPILFEYFSKSQFNIKSFQIEYNYEIKENIIANIVNKLTKTELVNKIKLMLCKLHKLFRNVDTICNELSDDILIHAFKPFYEIYNTIKYTRNYSKFEIYKSLFCKKSALFIKKNYLFGRKIFKRMKYNILEDNKFKIKTSSSMKIISEFVSFNELDETTISNKELKKIYPFDYDSCFHDWVIQYNEVDDDDDDDEDILYDTRNISDISDEYISEYEYEHSIQEETEETQAIEIGVNGINLQISNNVLSVIDNIITNIEITS